MYILGGVAIVGLAYYLFKKPTTTPSNSSSFANVSGPCGGCGYNQKWTTFLVYNPPYGYQTVNGCLSCVGSGTSK